MCQRSCTLSVSSQVRSALWHSSVTDRTRQTDVDICEDQGGKRVDL